MAELCDDCPLKRYCRGTIVEVDIVDVLLTERKPGPPRVARFAVALNAEGEPSEPVSYDADLEKDEIKEDFERRVGECTHPRPKFLRWLRLVRCGAIDQDVLPYEHTAAGYFLTRDQLLEGVTEGFRQRRAKE